MVDIVPSRCNLPTPFGSYQRTILVDVDTSTGRVVLSYIFYRYHDILGCRGWFFSVAPHAALNLSGMVRRYLTCVLLLHWTRIVSRILPSRICKFLREDPKPLIRN